MNFNPARARFNELATLLKDIDETALNELLKPFPQFKEEVRRGPAAGDRGEPADWSALEMRARFSLAISEQIVKELDNRWQGTLSKRRTLRRLRMGIAVAGAATGATVLGSLGLPKPVVTEIASIATAIISIVTAGTEFVSRSDNPKVLAALTEVRQSAFGLSILRVELAAAVDGRQDLADVTRLMERANKQASEIRKALDKAAA